MHLLLGDCVDVTEVAKAQELLTTFHRLIPELYPIEMYTANMNSLLLLSQFVRHGDHFRATHVSDLRG